MVDSGRYAPRVRQACRPCAIKKLKCTDTKPCRRCRAKNISCDYDQSPEPAQHQAPDAVEIEDVDGDVLLSEETDLGQASATAEMGWPQVPEEDGTHAEIAACSVSADVGCGHMDQSGIPGPVIEYGLTLSEMETLSTSNDVTFHDILGCAFDLPSFGDFIQPEPNIDFDGLDLPFLGDFITTPIAQSIDHSVSDSTALHSPAMLITTEAYEASQVRQGWIPGPNDINSETESLELPSTAGSDVLAMLRDKSSVLGKDNMTVGTRDKILVMIYSKTSKSIWARMSRTFELVDVLHGIILHALVHMQEKQLIPFMHLPSFNVNEQRPELLCALAAYGAVCWSSSTMRKFGYGLQELVRLSIHQKLEEECTSVRDLGVAQAYYIQLYLGFWSAISAKIEVAESSSMLGVTMIRRGKMLQAGEYQSPEEILALQGLSLKQKWMKWVKQESRIRLTYFAVLLDAGVSLARNINPLFAYSEMNGPVPASRRLWEAVTADEWYGILMHNTELELKWPYYAKRLLRQPQLIRGAQELIDTTAVTAVMLAGLWGLVYEYRQMELLHSENQDWNGFVLNSRYSDLVTLSDQMRSELSDLDRLDTQVTLFQELISLHLNAAYYEIANYAGRGTATEAQDAKPYVEWWHKGPQARRAMWHAGQIFRFVNMLNPGTLTDIPVIAIYHATEVLWVWGLMQRTQQPIPATDTMPKVILNDEESPEVMKFLRTSRGQPGISGSMGRFVPLTEPALIADFANDAIKTNWGTHIEPWTTSEVSRLIHGFSKIYRQRIAG
ncbi:hypothetical protein LTR84_003743 [Exophiala bonariae]|uniref:Zn(2)-C6 fungal-type domain-containing protein n=1 Tax=Exophiala bonariae TaxID=1690606 RepID=A0AAV9N756_9EURO|nr:hypothetical protein LTR84_003743 [Exophiala bonariae]